MAVCTDELKQKVGWPLLQGILKKKVANQKLETEFFKAI